MRRLLIPTVVILVAAGVAAFFLLRGGDEADLELTGGFGTRALDHAVRDVGASRYSGRGRVAALFTVESTRDEPLKIFVPAVGHVFDLSRCHAGSRVDVTHFGLDVVTPGGDRHAALIPLAIGSDKHELARYDDEAPGELRLRCGG